MQSSCFNLKFKGLVFRLERLDSKPRSQEAWPGGWGKQTKSEEKGWFLEEKQTDANSASKQTPGCIPIAYGIDSTHLYPHFVALDHVKPPQKRFELVLCTAFCSELHTGFRNESASNCIASRRPTTSERHSTYGLK